MWWIVIIVIFLFIILTALRYKTQINRAYDRLYSYQVCSINTEFGRPSYVDEGVGEAVLLSHGIFGGYDQAFVSLKNTLGESYRKIAPSRFGYPGTDLPSQPTPENQAKAFVEILDRSGIDKAFVITTSAGGAAGIKMALQYPERLKGLILLSSGIPAEKRRREEIRGRLGPPAPLVNDFPMWFTIKHLGFVLNAMFASEPSNDLFHTMLPVKPRKPGIKADETMTNLDMDVNYDDYPVEKITVPILLIQAKGDPLVKFNGVEKFIRRVQPRTAIFETGGHLITGHGDEVSKAIKNFIEETQKGA